MKNILFSSLSHATVRHDFCKISSVDSLRVIRLLRLSTSFSALETFSSILAMAGQNRSAVRSELIDNCDSPF